MAQHQIMPFMYNSYGDNQQIIKDPGVDGVFNLRGIWGGRAVIASGNRVLPDNIPEGVKLLVYSTGNSTLTNVATTTVATLAAGEMAECVSLTATSWGAVIYTAGALEINAAADLPIADVGAYTAATDVEEAIQELYSIPNAKFNTSAITSEVNPTAGVLSGARNVFWQNTANGALSLTTREAAEMFGDHAWHHVGYSYLLTIVNRGDNTITVSPNEGLTVTGETTIATLVTRTYLATFTSATALTLVSVAKGTIET